MAVLCRDAATACPRSFSPKLRDHERGTAGERESRRALVGRRCRAALIFGLRSNAALSFLESVPEVSATLKEPNTKPQTFEAVVKSAEQAAVLVLVY